MLCRRMVLRRPLIASFPLSLLLPLPPLSFPAADEVPEGLAASSVPLKDWDFVQKYFKMLKVGLPRPVCEHKMISEVSQRKGREGERGSGGQILSLAAPVAAASTERHICHSSVCLTAPSASFFCRVSIQPSWMPVETTPSWPQSYPLPRRRRPRGHRS